MGIIEHLRMKTINGNKRGRGKLKQLRTLATEATVKASVEMALLK